MAHIAIPPSWIGLLTRRRGPLLFYQWLWLLLCMIGALAAAAPQILSRPLIYIAVAEARFDVAPETYGRLYIDADPGPGFDISQGALSGDFQIVLHDAGEVLRQRAFAQREMRFGQPNYRSTYVPLTPGVVQAQGIAPTAIEAQQLANDAAAELVRQIRAAGGREILRNLLGHELVLALRGDQPSSRFQELLRVIIEREAFPFSLPLQPVSAFGDIVSLPPEQQNDVARALEARYDLWTFEITTRDATLDQACKIDRANVADPESALKQCAAGGPVKWEDTVSGQVVWLDATNELAARNQAIRRREAIEAALRYMIDIQGVKFAPDQPGAVQRVAAPLPVAPEDLRIVPLLALALLAGLAFGGIGVAVDQSAGVMPKLRELWAYRELIRNLVIRDLRVRYKGSALGYLWTQLAPLLMMLVFVFVFNVLLKSNIALYPVFLIVGLLPWNFCAEAVHGASRSIIDSANLIKKVFFPREVLPLVSVLSSLLNYLLSLPMMFLVMAMTQLIMLDGRLMFSWTFAYLPVLLIIQVVFLIGIALFMSALAVFFRDTVHLIGILLQFWFFLTPVVYSLDAFGTSPSIVRAIRWLNPMASLIDFYRDILYGNTVTFGYIPTPGLPALDGVLRVLITSLVILALGYWFFQRRSHLFGEEI